MHLAKEGEWEWGLRTCLVSSAMRCPFIFRHECCLRVSLVQEVYHMNTAEACLR